MPKTKNSQEKPPASQAAAYSIDAKKIGSSVADDTGISSSVNGSVAQAPQDDSLASIKDNFEKEKAELASGERPKRKYTRRQKPDAEQPTPIEPDKVAAFSHLGKVLVRMACTRMPNPIPASPEEEAIFSDALGAVIVKHWDSAGEYGAELALAAAAAMIAIPRLVTTGEKEPSQLEMPFNEG